MIQRYTQSQFFRKGFGIVFPSHYVYDFSRKIFVTLYSINSPNFIVWLPLIHEMLGNMCIAIICFPGYYASSFEINLIFFWSSRFSTCPKSQDKFLNILRIKKAFKVKWKQFPSFLNVFQVPKIVSGLRVCL